MKSVLSILFLLLISLTFVSAITETFEYTVATQGMYTWTVPAGVTTITVQAWGGGGGGGGGGGDWTSGGGGGGGGGYAQKDFSVTSGQTYQIMVGKWGDGGSSYSGIGGTGTTLGLSGGNSQFGSSLLIANGGEGGQSNFGVCTGSSGGRGGTSSTTGAIVVAGGNGGYGSGCTGQGTGGTGGIAPSENGGNGAGANGGGNAGGGGGASRDGNGGRGAGITNSPTCGENGIAPGGGGGGNGYYSSNCQAGTGAGGRIVITYTAAITPGGGGGSTPTTPSVISSCSSPSQTLFQVYQQNNTHVALYNATFSASGVTGSVCYDTLFGRNYTDYTGTSPWRCTGTNTVLKLAQPNNSHVESPERSTYPISICYGDLQCTVKQTQTCGSGEVMVASLSAFTNAHVSIGDDLAYPLRLCCTSGSTQALWTDREGYAIQEALIGERVNISVTGIPSSITSATLSIFKNGTSAVVASMHVPITNGNVRASWVIANDSPLFFRVVNNTFNVTGPVLSVYRDSSDSGGRHSILNGTITGVVQGQAYFTNSSIVFNHTFTRKPGMRYAWSIPEESFTTGRESFVYAFKTPGMKHVFLNVSDLYGNHSELEVVVLAGNSTTTSLAFIDTPRYRQVIPTGNLASISVPFNGSSLYVLNFSSLDCSAYLSCVGQCPAYTNNTRPGCTSISSINRTAPLNALTLSWYAKTDQSISPLSISSTSGSIILGNRDFSKNLFDRAFILKINYSSNNVIALFMRNYTLGTCIQGGKTYIDIDSLGRIKGMYSTIDPPEYGYPFATFACKGQDNVSGTPDDCVPSNYDCTDNNGGIPRINNTTPISGDCSFPTQISCEQGSRFIIQDNSFQCIGQTTIATCVWDNGKCKQETNVSTYDESTLASCIQDAQVVNNLCADAGYQEISYIATFSGNRTLCPAFTETCKDHAETLLCGRPVFELPFMGAWQALLSLFGIIGISLLFRRRESF